ncbi:MAG: DUF2442 domain-containing protein [Phycisphaerae bacterium]|nr:DUF2442 domain-containing protein [Phycisphaerae bacterium]
MKSKTHGPDTSAVEVTHINAHGLWLCVADTEYFLPYESYPWFKDARIRDVLDVRLLHDRHLHWPALDVDLEINSLKDPQKYPLVYNPR